MYKIWLKPCCSQPSNNHLRCSVEDEETNKTLMEFHNTAAVDEATLAFVAHMPEILDFLNLVAREHKMADLLLTDIDNYTFLLKKEATPKRKEEVA